MHTQVRDIVLCAGKCYANTRKQQSVVCTHKVHT